MQITDPLTFWGNAIAFVALVYKTTYDLIINPRRFAKEQKEMDIVKAVKQKRDRTDRSAMLTFLFLAVSSALMMFALIKFK